MAVSQEITLYNKTYTVPPVINAVQNDTDRQIVATLGDFTLASGMTAKLSFIRSDGTHYEATGTINTTNNTVTAELDQALTQVGICKAQIKVTETDGLGSTFTFIIKVQPDVAGISVPQDGWSAQEFDQRLTDAEDAIDAVEEDVADLQDKEYDYAPVITDTASGSIASFPDGADSYPLKECVVDVDAVQDLHGYNSPWPAGGGKNKVNFFDLSVATGVDQQDTLGNITLSAGTYTLSYTLSATVTATRNCPLYIIGGNVQYGNSVTTVGRHSWTFTLSEESTVTFKWWYHTVSPACTISKFMLVSGTDTDYAPYSNICPITGWSEAKIYVQPTVNPTAPPTVTIDLDGTRYGCVLDVTRGKLRVTHACVDVNSNNGTLRNNGQSAITTRAFFTPTVTKENGLTGFISNMFFITSAGDVVGKMNGRAASGGLEFFLPVSTPDTTEGVTQWFTDNPTQLCYPLATPIEVDLTPTEITTLLGTNNIFADTGDVEVEYCADTKRYIQKVISQLA